MGCDCFYLFEDELLYSGLGRYLKLNGEISLKDGISETFGDICSIPTYRFPCNLDKLTNRFPINDIFTSDYLIDNHTLFPVYSSFISTERKLEIVNQMKSMSGHGVQLKLGVIAGGLLRKSNLFFCPDCAVEELKKYGQAYFHRLHQIEGVIICDKHMRRLREYKSKILASRLEYKILGEEQIAGAIGSDNNLEYPEMMVWINNQFKALLGGVMVMNKDMIHSLYVHKLREIDLALPSGAIRQIDLYDKFKQRYSQELLSYLGSNIDVSYEYNWLKVITRNSRRSSHPLRHLLFTGFLFGDVNNLLEYSSINYQKHERYPCLNPVCKYYLKDVINTYIISYDYKAKREVGTFSCSCGFTYSRYLDKADKYKFGRIKDFGEVWKRELINRVNNGHNISQVAKILKCDKKTVIRQALKLGFGDKIKSKYNTIEEYDNKCYKTQVNRSFQVDLSYRVDAKKPCMNSTKARKRVDWDQRDEIIVGELISVLPTLYNRDRKYRVSKTLMCNSIGKTSLISKNIAKLPKANLFIDKNSESLEDFQCFRIDRVCKEIISEGEDLIRWKIIRKAGLRDNISKKVEVHINNWVIE